MGTETKENALALRNADVFWGNSQVLRDVSFALERGCFCCLTGPNGSGKSTLLSVLSRVQIPFLRVQNHNKNQGKGTEVLLDGEETKGFSRKQLSQRIAYLPQSEERIWDYSVRDVVLGGRFCHTGGGANYTKHDFEVTERCLETLHIEHLSSRSVRALSGGEWQKVRIARAVAQESDYLLLDEPVANLDFAFQDELMGFLKAMAEDEGKGVLVSIHDLNEASRFAGRMALLQKISSLKEGENQCFVGTVSEVMRPERLERAYGAKVGTFIHPAYGSPQVYNRPERKLQFQNRSNICGENQKSMI